MAGRVRNTHQHEVIDAMTEERKPAFPTGDTGEIVYQPEARPPGPAVPEAGPSGVSVAVS